MVARSSTPLKTLKNGRKILKHIVSCQYSLLVSTATGIAGAVYFFIIGPRNVVGITSIAVTFFASALSAAYLILHQVLAWRYCKSSTDLYRRRKDYLCSVCMTTSSLVIIAWLTASILGLISASKAPFCDTEQPKTLEWRTIVGCKIQRASVAGSLLTFLNACILFYALNRSDRPFAASLLGIHVRKLNIEQELYLSVDLSPTPSENSCEKIFSIPTCDPNYYATLDTPTPPPRVRRSWLPPLKFQAPLETEHPALRSLLIPSTATPSQTNLLPSPTYPKKANRSFTHPGLARSQTAVTACSSVYSRATSDSASTSPSSAFSSHPGTLSSFSLSSHPSVAEFSCKNSGASSQPSVPVIPEEYRHRGHTLRDGGSPVRPGSRPGMPPAEFWDYVSGEQQRQPSPRHQRADSAWPGSPLEQKSKYELDSPSEQTSYSRPHPQRPSTAWPSVSSEASVSTFRTAPLPTSPNKAILRSNINKGNVMMGKKTSFEMVTVGRKRSYEHVRKESQIVLEVDYGRLEEAGHQRKGSRTLVKQRQPRDPAPRAERGKKASF